MTFEESLYSYLSNYADLSTLIGTRIYPLKAEQKATSPYLVYQTISTERDHALQADTGMAMPTVQFSIYGTTYSSVKDVAEALRAALQNFSGVMGTNGVTVQAVLLQNELDGYEDDTKLYYRLIDYEFMVEEG